ncbi:hypothetical protein EDD16DRAFT_984319 [Pisolithus croceorrhizus]|nr:hypothetical protein EDD16DRAFT_984319 [Pisolithus croceorrhizus]
MRGNRATVVSSSDPPAGRRSAESLSQPALQAFSLDVSTGASISHCQEQLDTAHILYNATVGWTLVWKHGWHPDILKRDTDWNTSIPKPISERYASILSVRIIGGILAPLSRGLPLRSITSGTDRGLTVIWRKANILGYAFDLDAFMPRQEDK